MSKIWGICGDRGWGKTRFCQSLLGTAQQQNIPAFGFYCPARFEDGEKVGIDLRLVPTDETYPLGDLLPTGEHFRVGRWSMYPEAFEKAKAHLLTYKAQPLVVLDEIGPLEVEDGEGWVQALDLLSLETVRTGVVAFRPSLKDKMISLFPAMEVIELAPNTGTGDCLQHILSSIPAA